jgi:transcriptional regulator with XRE-family HTH domain
MESHHERRRELGGFLRWRRQHLLRADYQLPPVGRSRQTGLRREEIAFHAGVSVTWYTLLEQGKAAHPSRQVLDALAQTMRLSLAEHQYILALAGYVPEPPGDPVPPAVVPPHIQRLLDAHVEAPAFAVSPDWTIAGWNRAYQALYPKVATVNASDRNLLWIIFTDPYVRSMLPDWEVTSGHFLAEYRAQAGPSLGHPAHAALVKRLLDTSPEFSRAWNQHQVERFASRERRFHHPDVGELTFEHHRLTPSDLPDLHVVVYLPLDYETRGKMRRLVEALAR